GLLAAAAKGVLKFFHSFIHTISDAYRHYFVGRIWLRSMLSATLYKNKTPDKSALKTGPQPLVLHLF
ncbi:MAG: hypothetical protein QGH37_33860, partial [Candidatus Poribacteria bacterium]|nr:hypothetical protein [Candidatus Poribacteria bacterium]